MHQYAMFLRRKLHGPNKHPQHSKGPKECDQSNAIFEGIALGQQQENSEKELVIYDILDLYI